jgi:predicted DNA-binding transcriptional regulator YafY
VINETIERKRAMVCRVIQRSETLILWFRYRDAKGNQTKRAVSPYQMLGDNRFRGLCLVREESRQFDLRRCEELQIGLSSDVLMPIKTD